MTTEQAQKDYAVVQGVLDWWREREYIKAIPGAKRLVDQSAGSAYRAWMQVRDAEKTKARE